MSNGNLMTDIFLERKLIWKLSKNDFKTKYAGSFLGIVWGFVQPIITVVVYWLVFQYGLRASNSGDVPYVLWFVAGMIPWFYFSESLMSATNCLLEYNYLVKKMAFKIDILPVVKLISSFFVHIAFIVFFTALTFFYGWGSKINFLQIVYYFVSMALMTLGLSYITSAVVVFVRDIGQIISIFLQIFMWATPILWNYTMVPEKFRWILSLNPMYYIVEGYRNAFLGGGYPWSRLGTAVYFWVVTVILLVAGKRIFRRLKPHLADVL